MCIALVFSLIAQIHYAYATFANQDMDRVVGWHKGSSKINFLSRKIETEQRRSASANLHTIK